MRSVRVNRFMNMCKIQIQVVKLLTLRRHDDDKNATDYASYSSLSP